jgi:hypothetical protein
MEGEYIVVAGWPVQFFPAANPLVLEALEQDVEKMSRAFPRACSPPNTWRPSRFRPDAPRTKPACSNSSKPAHSMRRGFRTSWCVTGLPIRGGDLCDQRGPKEGHWRSAMPSRNSTFTFLTHPLPTGSPAFFDWRSLCPVAQTARRSCRVYKGLKRLTFNREIAGTPRTGVSLERLEPCEGKLSRTVLRGVRAG